MDPRSCVQCGLALPAEAPSELCSTCSSVATLSEAGDTQTDRDHPTGTGTPGVLSAGLTLGRGRFRLVRRLGRGGLGDVWLAEDRQLGAGGETARVALKFLHPRLASNPRRLDEFRTELLRSRDLAHPNIIRLYDWHETPGEPVFYSMEYVAGVTLQQLAGETDQRLNWQTLGPWVTQICEALHFAHTTQGLVHSDLKPANIMVTDRGVKVGDFGMARRVASQDGQVAAEVRRGGTRVYMGPQQFRGEPAQFSDDIYSLGATLFQLLTGEVPIPDGEHFAYRLESAAPDTVFQRLTQLQLGSDIPAEVNELVARCLAKDADRRPASLRKAGLYLNLPPVDWRLHGLEPVRQRAVPWGPVLAATAAMAVAGFTFYDSHRRGAESYWARVIEWIFADDSQPPKPPTTVVADTRRETNVIDPEQMLARLEVVLTRPSPEISSFEWQLLNAQGQVEHSGKAQTQTPLLDLRGLAPGTYELELGSGPKSARNWLAQSVTLTASNTLPLSVDFAPGWHQLLVNHTNDTMIEVLDRWTRTPVRVDWSLSPKGGRLEWHSTRGPELRAGEVTYRATAPYHFPLEVLATVSPGVRGAKIELALKPCPYPQPAFRFTNQTLDLVFQPVGDFWAAETETTVGHFQKFAAANPDRLADATMRSTSVQGLKPGTKTWRNAFEGQTNSHPVVGVGWEEAQAFAAWLTAKEKDDGHLSPTQHYSLPTDAQWSQLAEAGSKKFPWGDWPPGRGSGNYAGEEVQGRDWPADWSFLRRPIHEDDSPRTAPVRSYRANNFGLYEVGGNAAEWCLDPYLANLNDPDVLADNPILREPAAPGGFRVVRGGSWADDDPYDLLTATRQRSPPEERNDRIGFRLVLVEDTGSAPP